MPDEVDRLGKGTGDFGRVRTGDLASAQLPQYSPGRVNEKSCGGGEDLVSEFVTITKIEPN